MVRQQTIDWRALVRLCKMQRAKAASRAASIAPESVFDAESFINEYYGAWSGTIGRSVLKKAFQNSVKAIEVRNSAAGATGCVEIKNCGAG